MPASSKEGGSVFPQQGENFNNGNVFPQLDIASESVVFARGQPIQDQTVQA